MATEKTRRTKKTKFVTVYSPFLAKETKHELIGEPVETTEGIRQQWARCTKSHHTQLVNLTELEAVEAEADAVPDFTREGAITYNPRSEFQINDLIYHTKWDDVGLVCAKEITSNGGHAIVVKFEKSKERRLVEKLSI